ncbi:MAG: hypothetical protein K2X47_02160, partial [Bdellovibrionales bacterium]|nr:hypothetical protein [Bdellovibrionales bacterium]
QGFEPLMCTLKFDATETMGGTIISGETAPFEITGRETKSVPYDIPNSPGWKVRVALAFGDTEALREKVIISVNITHPYNTNSFVAFFNMHAIVNKSDSDIVLSGSQNYLYDPDHSKGLPYRGFDLQCKRPPAQKK